MRRFVLDASVLLSAALAKPESNPSLLLDAVRAGAIEMVAAPDSSERGRFRAREPLLPRPDHT